MLIEEQVVAAKMRARQVPVEILGFDVECKKISNQRVESLGDPAYLLLSQIGHCCQLRRNRERFDGDIGMCLCCLPGSHAGCSPYMHRCVNLLFGSCVSSCMGTLYDYTSPGVRFFTSSIPGDMRVCSFSIPLAGSRLRRSRPARGSPMRRVRAGVAAGPPRLHAPFLHIQQGCALRVEWTKRLHQKPWD